MNRNKVLDSTCFGWEDLINQFYDKVDEWNLFNPENKITIDDVKSKYGELRVLFSPDIKDIDDVYTEIIIKSSITCEICGITGKKREIYYGNSPYEEPWIETLCDAHYVNHSYYKSE
jgi:hypothetical protein